ncbi:hypothetical protein BFJ63_vAg16501 [Fusarium oxysporum f. sp. narcissi]|uniref:Uncharacterized protein n=1 Tax=Fusarium oxysporum f. sp. narcissi TaxID=451672 RepID=A0A4Q2V168_FUSOX|nr:hypothetical protein BFJ67_g16713 [Fusarium oxysporum f. sp. cepae]RYC80611.1 hypothetical protein BFJ63_vAg16501 [Fusarium oxysporum f. sp. narcissi]
MQAGANTATCSPDGDDAYREPAATLKESLTRLSEPFDVCILSLGPYAVVAPADEARPCCARSRLTRAA